MSVEASKTQYRQAFVDQFETKISAFRVATTKETMGSGESVKFLVAGSGTDTAVSRGVNSLIPYGNPTNTQVSATLVEKHAPYELTGFNIFASQGDQKAIMRQASMSVINRDIDLTVLAELANATIDTGAYATASLAMVVKAKAYLGNQDVPTQEADNMFAAVSPMFMANLMQTTEFASADYVDVKPFVGPTRKMLRWAGVNWIETNLVTGVGTSRSFATCGTARRWATPSTSARTRSPSATTTSRTLSWSRATIFHAAKILQNTGIVQLKHDGSASNLS
jgi:hypothetical protein